LNAGIRDPLKPVIFLRPAYVIIEPTEALTVIDVTQVSVQQTPFGKCCGKTVL